MQTQQVLTVVTVDSEASAASGASVVLDECPYHTGVSIWDCCRGDEDDDLPRPERGTFNKAQKKFVSLAEAPKMQKIPRTQRDWR